MAHHPTDVLLTWHAVHTMTLPAHVMLLRGGEKALVDRATREALRSFHKSSATADEVSIDAASEDAAANLHQATSPTLFGSDTIVIISNAQAAGDDLRLTVEEILVDLPEHVWLIVQHDGSQGGKRLVEDLRAREVLEVDCSTVKRGKQTTDLLTKEFSRLHRHATAEAIEALYEAVGQDLQLLFSAIEQLASDIPDDPITDLHVRAYFSGVADVAGWQIADAVWQRQPARALETLRHATVAGNGTQVGLPAVLALTTALREIILVGSLGPGASNADIAREVGIPPWKAKLLKAQWNRWSGSQRRLAQSLVTLSDAEVSMKGGLDFALDVDQKEFEVERLVTTLGAR